jgi:hypothetical protein
VLTITKGGNLVTIEGVFRDNVLCFGKTKFVYNQSTYETDYNSTSGILKGKVTNSTEKLSFTGEVKFEKGLLFPPTPYNGIMEIEVKNPSQGTSAVLISARVTIKNGERDLFIGQDSTGGTWKGSSPRDGKLVGHYTNPAGPFMIQRSKNHHGLETYEGEAFISSKMQVMRHGQGTRTIKNEKNEELERFVGEWDNHNLKKGHYTSVDGFDFDLEIVNDKIQWSFKNGGVWLGNNFENGVYKFPTGTILAPTIVGEELYQGSAALYPDNGGTVVKHGKGKITISDDGKELETLTGEFEKGTVMRGKYTSIDGSALEVDNHIAKGILVTKDIIEEGEWWYGSLYQGYSTDRATGEKKLHTPEQWQNSQHHHHHDHNCADHHHHDHHHDHHDHHHHDHNCTDPTHQHKK